MLVRHRCHRRLASQLRPVGVIVIHAVEKRPRGVVDPGPGVDMDELLGRIPADADVAVRPPQVVADLPQLDAADPEVDRARVAVRRSRRLAVADAVRRDVLDGLVAVAVGDRGEHRERLLRDHLFAVRRTAPEHPLDRGGRRSVGRPVAPDRDRAGLVLVLVVEIDLDWSGGVPRHHHRNCLCRNRNRASCCRHPRHRHRRQPNFQNDWQQAEPHARLEPRRFRVSRDVCCSNRICSRTFCTISVQSVVDRHLRAYKNTRR